LFWLFLLVNFTQVVLAQSPRLGAYYFDGWTGRTPWHLTTALVDSFPEREPRWGWLTSTPAAVYEQIDVAADAGLSFFSFCWYYPEGDQRGFRENPHNHALGLYLRAPNRARLDFCLLVANHAGSTIGPQDWPVVSRYWLDLFKNPQYVRANGKPLLIFFTAGTLVKKFGTPDAVRQALDSLRTVAKAEGLPGVTIAVATGSDAASLRTAQACGFDVLTGYNYHGAGFRSNQKQVPIDSLRTGTRRVWDGFRRVPQPYIPVVTLHWDPRPWASQNQSYATSPRYLGFSSESVYRGVRDALDWLRTHPDRTVPERLALIYAWNEYGEGAWLTPSKASSDNPLDGLRRALNE
jgi:hypothetical protein